MSMNKNLIVAFFTVITATLVAPQNAVADSNQLQTLKYSLPVVFSSAPTTVKVPQFNKSGSTLYAVRIRLKSEFDLTGTVTSLGPNKPDSIEFYATAFLTLLGPDQQTPLLNLELDADGAADDLDNEKQATSSASVTNHGRVQTMLNNDPFAATNPLTPFIGTGTLSLPVTAHTSLDIEESGKSGGGGAGTKNTVVEVLYDYYSY